MAARCSAPTAPWARSSRRIRTPAQDSVTGPNPVFTTLFSYDTWNRIQNLTYADGEVVSFNYDSGGNIKAITGQKQAVAYPYLNFIGYDKFEARERVALGNGTATNYSYNPLNRRLTGLLAQTKSARTFMNMSYGYDAAGNIKTLANSDAVPTSITKGGATSYSFGYDDLYQLTSSTGAFAKPGMATQKFTLAMSYDGIHNITHKTQAAFNLLSNGSTTPNVALSYDYPYAYAGGRPHAASQAGNHAFLYDLDGNQAGWNATDSYQNRRMTWDEDGRLQSVIDNAGQPTTFKYDGDTNRVVKKGAGGETLYINPWYVAALGRNSKQIFAGTTRIVTSSRSRPPARATGRAPRTSRRSRNISTTRTIWGARASPPTPPARSGSTWSTSRSAKPGSTRSPTMPACRIGSQGRSSTRRHGSITTGQDITTRRRVLGKAQIQPIASTPNCRQLD